MAATTAEGENPFADPIDFDGSNNDLADNTLVVSRDVSLTLGTDSLVVLGTVITHTIGSQ